MWFFFHFSNPICHNGQSNRTPPHREENGWGKKRRDDDEIFGDHVVVILPPRNQKRKNVVRSFSIPSHTDFLFFLWVVTCEWVSEWALVIIIYSIKWSHMNTTITITSTLILKLYMYIWFESHAFLVKSYGFFLLSTFWVPIFRSHFI